SQRLVLVLAVTRRLQSLLEPKHRRFRHPLLNETMPEHVATLQVPRGAVARLHQTCRGLELLDGLVHEIHLFIRSTHIVMRLVVFANLIAFFSGAKLFKQLRETGIYSRRHWFRSTNIVAIVDE